MSPASHSIAGGLIGYLALKAVPEIAQAIDPFLFVSLNVLAGNWPDVDYSLHKVFSKQARKNNPLLEHRGYGHSIGAHFLMSLLSPCFFGLFDPTSFLFLVVAAVVWLQIAVHLLLDMIDGSFGVYYFAPFCRRAFRSYALVIDLEEDFHRWRPESHSRLKQRVLGEAGLVVLPISAVFCWLLIVS